MISWITSINSSPRINSKIKQSRNIDSLGSNRIRANLIEKKYWSKSWEKWIKSIRVRISIQFKNRSVRWLINCHRDKWTKGWTKSNLANRKLCPENEQNASLLNEYFTVWCSSFFFFFFFQTDVSIRRNRATVTHTHTYTPRYLWIFSRCFEHIIFIYNLAIHRWRVRQSRGVTSVQSFPHSLPPSLEKRCDYKTEARYWNEKKKGRRGRKKEKNILDAISRNNEERFLTRKITR